MYLHNTLQLRGRPLDPLWARYPPQRVTDVNQKSKYFTLKIIKNREDSTWSWILCKIPVMTDQLEEPRSQKRNQLRSLDMWNKCREDSWVPGKFPRASRLDQFEILRYVNYYLLFLAVIADTVQTSACIIVYDISYHLRYILLLWRKFQSLMLSQILKSLF